MEREANLAPALRRRQTPATTLNTAVRVLFLQAAAAVRQPAEGEAQVSELVFEVRRRVTTFLARYAGYTAQAERPERVQRGPLGHRGRGVLEADLNDPSLAVEGKKPPFRSFHLTAAFPAVATSQTVWLLIIQLWSELSAWWRLVGRYFQRAELLKISLGTVPLCCRCWMLEVVAHELVNQKIFFFFFYVCVCDAGFGLFST